MTQVVLLTGASLGIGRATADYLARKGYRVFGTSRTARPSANGVTFLPLDVTQPDSVAACVAEVIAQAGRIDILINNAGLVGCVGGPEELSDDQWHRVMETNLMGTVRMVRAVLPHMRKQRHGLIINISSLAGVIAAPYYFGPYIASKHAVEGFTESLRAEIKPFGLRAAVVELGYMKTAIGLSVDPPAMPLDVYAPYRQRAYDVEQYALEKGRDPIVVAKTIERVIQSPNPALHNPAGQEAEMFVRLMRPVSHRPIEALLGWLLSRPDRWEPETSPLQRLFMDTQFNDQVQKRATLISLLMLPLVFVAWLRHKRS